MATEGIPRWEGTATSGKRWAQLSLAQKAFVVWIYVLMGTLVALGAGGAIGLFVRTALWAAGRGGC